MHAEKIIAGRSCRKDYSYTPFDISLADESTVDTLYVIGGLYGNTEALQTILGLSAYEQSKPTLCFNGDFNWFNCDVTSFRQINTEVLQHDATLGNVEVELFSQDTDVGCGCAYPYDVSSDIVERSNAIHLKLKNTAQTFPDILTELKELPLFKRYSVGSCTIGVVHGDAYSLAGWSFDQENLRNYTPWLPCEVNKNFLSIAQQANVSLFACSHTCLPALLHTSANGKDIAIINNGAAGMPNFKELCEGLISRISIFPSPYPSLYGIQMNNIFIDAISIPYNIDTWEKTFLSNWPKGSEAYMSYFERITKSTSYALSDALIHLAY